MRYLMRYILIFIIITVFSSSFVFADDNIILTISGPDAPQNGSQYTASGGTEPYTWSITKGSINPNGVVTVSGQCGAATVTATDSCGNTDSKDVRMPNGVWVLTYTDDAAINSYYSSGTYRFCRIPEIAVVSSYGEYVYSVEYFNSQQQMTQHTTDIDATHRKICSLVSHPNSRWKESRTFIMPPCQSCYPYVTTGAIQNAKVWDKYYEWRCQ